MLFKKTQVSRHESDSFKYSIKITTGMSWKDDCGPIGKVQSEGCEVYPSKIANISMIDSSFNEEKLKLKAEIGNKIMPITETTFDAWLSQNKGSVCSTGGSIDPYTFFGTYMLRKKGESCPSGWNKQ